MTAGRVSYLSGGWPPVDLAGLDGAFWPASLEHLISRVNCFEQTRAIF
jgi:hypothetical protein